MSPEECRERGATLSASIKIKVAFTQWDKDDKGKRKLKESQEAKSRNKISSCETQFDTSIAAEAIFSLRPDEPKTSQA